MFVRTSPTRVFSGRFVVAQSSCNGATRTAHGFCGGSLATKVNVHLAHALQRLLPWCGSCACGLASQTTTRLNDPASAIRRPLMSVLVHPCHVDTVYIEGHLFVGQSLIRSHVLVFRDFGRELAEETIPTSPQGGPHAISQCCPVRPTATRNALS